DSLWRRRLSDAKSKVVSALVLGVPLGAGGLALIFLLDMMFISVGVSVIFEVVPKFTFIISGLMLGLQAGFYEEALWRLGLLSFLAWVLKRWSWNRWGANVMIALLFGLGHIPALLLLAQEATSLLIIRTVLLNAVMGVIFGYCYIKRGYGSAVSAHFTANFINYGLIQPLLT
ncbi:MAG: CPBP family intramembrane glutamic endopeptidase, partial [Nitrososphaerales archaeon]